MVKSVTIEVLQTWLNTIKSVHTLQIFLLVDGLDSIQSSLWYLKCHRLDYIPSTLPTPRQISNLWIDLMVFSQVCNNWNCNRLDCIPSTLSTPRQISHLWIDLTVFSQVCYNCKCEQTWRYTVESVHILVMIIEVAIDKGQFKTFKYKFTS